MLQSCIGLSLWRLRCWWMFVAVMAQSPHFNIANSSLGGNSLCNDISVVGDIDTNTTTETAPISTPRLRRDWHSLTDAQVDSYLSALEESMRQGLYQRFLFYHLDAVSAIQAHDTCAFMLWHRRYLLALENMLRSLDTKYSCLTVPYWNIMDDYAAQQERLCDSFAGCSVILRDIGGNTAARQSQTRSYGTETLEGAYYTGRPFGFATDNNGQPGIIREDLMYVPLPRECSMDRLLRTIASHDNYNDFSIAIQRSIHDAVHDAVGGFMPTNASPSDVIFLNWHSAIDLFHTVWLQCHLGDHTLSSSSNTTSDEYGQETTSPFAFTQDGSTCGHTGQGTITFPFLNSSSEMYMRWGDTDIRDDDLIGRYYQDVGLQFQDMADARTMGENAFRYDLPRRMQVFLASAQCPNSNYQLTPMPTPLLVPTAAPTLGQTMSLSELEQWTQLIQDRVYNAYPNDQFRREDLMLYLDCIVEYDSSVRFSHQFVLEFVRGEVLVDECLYILQETPGPEATNALPSSTSTTPVLQTSLVHWCGMAILCSAVGLLIC